MKYQKIINSLKNTLKQQQISGFRIKNWFEISDSTSETYKSQSAMLKSS